MTRIRLPLKRPVGENDVETLARNRGWLFWQEVARSEATPYEVIWITRDEATRVHYIEDHIIGLDYLLFEGADAAQLTRDARQSLGVYTLADITQLFATAKTPDDFIEAIYIAAVAAPTQTDPEYVRLFDQTFSHPAPDVRHAAIVGTGYVGWPELRSRLEQLAASDPDEGVRRDAALMNEALETHPPQEAG